jgi:hypothetical protein
MLAAETVPTPAAQRHHEKRRRVQLDVGPDHKPATQLDGGSIRALLADRAPLLRPRRALAEQAVEATSDSLHVVCPHVFAMCFYFYRTIYVQLTVSS